MNVYAPPVHPGRASLRRVESGGINRDSLSGDPVHLLEVPIAGIGDHDLRTVIDTCPSEFGLRGVEHRL